MPYVLGGVVGNGLFFTMSFSGLLMTWISIASSLASLLVLLAVLASHCSITLHSRGVTIRDGPLGLRWPTLIQSRDVTQIRLVDRCSEELSLSSPAALAIATPAGSQEFAAGYPPRALMQLAEVIMGHLQGHGHSTVVVDEWENFRCRFTNDARDDLRIDPIGYRSESGLWIRKSATIIAAMLLFIVMSMVIGTQLPVRIPVMISMCWIALPGTVAIATFVRLAWLLRRSSQTTIVSYKDRRITLAHSNWADRILEIDRVEYVVPDGVVVQIAQESLHAVWLFLNEGSAIAILIGHDESARQKVWKYLCPSDSSAISCADVSTELDLRYR